MTYELKIAGLTRQLPLCPLDAETMLASFVLFGDVELTCACAQALLQRVPDFDYLVAPEAKAIPLAHEMARQSGRNQYLLLRKAPKVYMQGYLETDDQSITTKHLQKLYLDQADARRMAGKRVLLVDDVISTGGSMAAMERLVTRAGAQVVGRAAILAEGQAACRKDILFLEALPLFRAQGDPIPLAP